MLALAALIGAARMSPAYSVLTHEEVVDLLGKDQIRPLLVKRFPFAQRRRPEEGPCVRLRRLSSAKHGVLPIGKQVLQ